MATSRRRVERLEGRRWTGGDLSRLPDAELHRLIRETSLQEHGTSSAARAACLKEFIADGMSPEDAEGIVRDVFGPPQRM